MTQKQRSSIHNGRHGNLYDRSSNIKVMLIIFLIVHSRYCAWVCSTWSDCQWEFLLRGFDTTKGKCEAQTVWDVKKGDWLLHHDNAPEPNSFVVTEFLTKNNMTTIPHPAHSPDLATCELKVFHKMKLRLKGRCFISIEQIQAESQQVLNMLMPADFNECFQKW